MRVRRESGYSLIEMTMMIAVGAVLFTGLAFGAQVHFKAATDNRNYLVALHLAKRQMAILNNSAYPAVSSETALAADGSYPDFIPTQEVVSVATNGANSLREVRIRIRKNSGSGPVLVVLYTYLTDLVSFGDGI